MEIYNYMNDKKRTYELEGVEKIVDSRGSDVIMIEAERVMAGYSARGDSDE